MEVTSTQDIAQFIKNGYASVKADRQAAHEATILAQQNEHDYEAELRHRLIGTRVQVTGSTETVQRIGQDGLEHIIRSDRLDGEELVIISIFVTAGTLGFGGGSGTPLAYAARPERNAEQKVMRGSEVSFRLLDVHLVILD